MKTSRPKRRRPSRKHGHLCGFCGVEITLREFLELGAKCWICARNIADRQREVDCRKDDSTAEREA
jgi:hypothetical protein